MKFIPLLPVIALVFAALTGCERPKGPATAAPPPPKVTAAKPIVRDFTQWDEFTGTLAPVENVNVKSQVSGFVDSVSFTEGAIVKKGDVLLTIDSRIFRAQLDNALAAVQEAKARVELAQAQLELSRNDLKRGTQAARGGGISQEELDTRRLTVSQNEASVAQAQASISVAQANVEAAQLNVDWCKVTAPITGRISSKNITAGNMLTGGPGQTTVITTITSVDPIYCYIDADENHVLKYQQLAREKKRVSAADQPIPCYMGLQNETGFPHTGVLDFVDNVVDRTTGTRRARGVFPNPDGTLLPGLFARFRVVGQEFKNAILVLDDCIGTDQDRKFVYLLHPDKTIERRTVTIGPLEGALRLVVTGIAADDLVLINGLSGVGMVRPGGTVDAAITPMEKKPLLQEAAQPATTSAPAPVSQTKPTTVPSEASK